MTVPTVTSINRVGSPVTNATSVDYAVTFSEAITGVDLNDFVLTTGSTAAGNIASLSGSGSVYTVTVSTVSGDGTLRLDLNSSGTGIVSTSSASPIASGFIGNAYTIDHTAPTISSVLVPANATYATNQSLDFTVNFTEAVSADISGGTPRIAIALNTGGTVYANYLSGSGTSGLTFRYTVVAGNADNDGITVGTLDLNGATIKDSAGNNGVLTLNSVGSTSGVLVVAPPVPPVFDSAVVTGNSLVMSYVEATTLDASNTPTSGAFAVTVGGLSVAVTGVAVNAAAKTATLTLATAVSAGQAVTVAYTDPTAGNDINALQNAAGTDAVSLAATAVTNNTTLVVASVAVPASASYTVGDTLNFTVNFSEAVTADVSGGTPRLAITLDTGGTVYANYVSGSGSNALVFRYTVAAGNADADGIAVASTLDPNGATIQAATGTNALLTLHSVGSTSGVLVVAPPVPPVFDSAVVTGNSLVMSYVEATTLDASNTPTSGAFAVTVGGLSVAVTGVAVNAAAKTATLTLATAVSAGQAVTVAYTDPTAGNDINALQNAAGTDAVSLAATAVTNNTTLVVASVAVPASASYTVGDTLNFTVNFSEAVTADVSGGTPRLAITLDTGGTVYANYVSGSGSNALVFRYTVAAGNADADGIAVASTLDPNGATIQAATGTNALLTLHSVGSTSGVLVVAPPVPPVFSAAAVTGNSLVIRYVEATPLDAVNKPATSAFEVKVGGVADTVTAVTIDAAAKTATLTLATAVSAGQAVTVAYTDPTAGNDLNALQNAAGTDAVSFSATAATNNTVAPSVPASGGLTVTASANGGVLQGTAQADTFIGSAFKDTIYPAGGADSVDGGSGIDTVVLTGTRAQYGISHQADGTYTVRSLTDANTVVTMKSVERLTFDNQTVALDSTPTTGRVAELYHLALGRNPEESGLAFYVGASSQGLSTTQLAMNFVSSFEFAKTHGALDNTSFVTQLYQSAFNRAPDATGFAYFMNQLAASPGATGQAAVIANFIDSPEMTIKLAGVMDQGVALLAV